MPSPTRFPSVAVALCFLVQLPSLGAANQTFTLPAGFGWTSDINDPVLESDLEFSDDGGGQWTSTNVQSIYVMEESKPIFIKVSQLHYNEATQVFTLDAVSVTSEHKRLLDQLAAVNAVLDNPDKAVKRSNDFLCNSVSAVNANPTVSTAADGSAKLSATFTLGAGGYWTHFPYGLAITMAEGSVKVAADQVVSSQSTLSGVAPVSISYTQGCASCPDAAAAGLRMGSFNLTPDQNEATLTADGGLRMTGTLNNPAPLAWGHLPDGDANPNNDQFAHRMFNSFATGTVVVSGTFVRSTAHASPQHLASTLHLTGFRSENNALVAERPGSQDYAEGEGDYAGLNLRCTVNGPFTAISHLAGTFTDVYGLTARSKYVVRAGGVSGRHNAVDTGPVMNVALYGYDCKFTSFGLAFLDNSNTDATTGRQWPSRVRGTLALANPSNITIPFERLNFNCVGGVTEFTPPASYTGDLLNGWQMQFTASRIRFQEPASAAACGAPEAVLCVSVKAAASFVSAPLFAELGFKNNGTLVRPVDPEGVPGRFPMPTRFTIPGPNGQTFGLISCEDAYLSHLAADASDGGFFNLAATVDVPFFEDIPVHAHVSALGAPGAGQDPQMLYLMGGWPDNGFRDANGGHFFNREVADTSNVGVPDGFTVATYRSVGIDGQDGDYVPRARQTWIDNKFFDLPLRWNPTRHVFVGLDTVKQDVMMLDKADAQVTLVSPRETEIKFGKSYTLLPRISLANMAFDAVADGLGVSGALHDGFGDLADKLFSGVDALKRLSSDQSEAFMGSALDAALGGAAFDALYNALRAAEGEAAVLAVVDRHLSTAGNGGAMTRQLFNAVGITGAVPGVMTSSASDIQKALDAIDGLTADGGALTSGPVHQVLIALVLAVAPAFADELGGEFDAAFAEAQEALAQVKESLKVVRSRLAEIQSAMDANGVFTTELKDLAQARKQEVSAAVNAASGRIGTRVSQALARAGGVDDLTKEEWKQILLRELKDAVVTSTGFSTGVQNTMRQHVSMAESAWRQTLDDLFAELNGMLAKVIVRSIPGVDSSTLRVLEGVMVAGRIDGYAQMRGDSLAELRLNAEATISVPQPMEFNGYYLVRDLRVTGPGGNGNGPQDYVLVEVGAERVPLNWSGAGGDLNATIRLKLAYNAGSVIGFGGSFDMQGKMEMDGLSINKLTGAFMAALPGGGAHGVDTYVSAAADISLGDLGMAGGMFIGRTRSMEPIAMWDPFVADFLGQPNPTFTGAYQYAEGRMPLLSYGCAFNVSAGLGAGLFAFLEGPTIGGRIHAEVKGEALCTLTVKGEVDLLGAASPDGIRFRGKGKLKGKAGWCPCCVKFRKTVTFSYHNQEWSADY